MDSWNVMRGSKSGFAVRLTEKSPHLLDIDDDTCHHTATMPVRNFAILFKNMLRSTLLRFSIILSIRQIKKNV